VENSGCRACGICCELYGAEISAVPADAARWEAEGRADLLARVGEEGRLWRDPVRGDFEPVCPWFVRVDSDRARCAIHSTKPAVCRNYPTELHNRRCVRGFTFR
jgi:Fe-S-cluster containining protein